MYSWVFRINIRVPGPLNVLTSKPSQPNKSICKLSTGGANIISVVGDRVVDGIRLGGYVVDETVGDFVVPSLVGCDDRVGNGVGDPLDEEEGGLEFVGAPVCSAVVDRGVGGNVGRLVFRAFVGQRLIVGAHVGRFVLGAFVGKSEIVGDHVGRFDKNAAGSTVGPSLEPCGLIVEEPVVVGFSLTVGEKLGRFFGDGSNDADGNGLGS